MSYAPFRASTIQRVLARKLARIQRLLDEEADNLDARALDEGLALLRDGRDTLRALTAEANHERREIELTRKSRTCGLVASGAGRGGAITRKSMTAAEPAPPRITYRCDSSGCWFEMCDSRGCRAVRDKTVLDWLTDRGERTFFDA